MAGTLKTPYSSSALRYNIILLAALTLFILIPVACDRQSQEKQDVPSFRLFFRPSGEASGTYYIEEYKVSGFTKLDSLKPTGKIEYQKHYQLLHPTVFALADEFGERMIFPALPADSLLIVLPEDNLDKSILSGSATIQSFNRLTQRTHQFLDSTEYYSAMVRDSLGSPEYTKLRLKANQGYQKNLEDLRAFYRQFILENDTSILGLLALQNQIGPGYYVLDPMEDFGLYLRVDSMLSELYPSSGPVMAFSTRVDKLLKKQMQNSNPQTLPGK